MKKTVSLLLFAFLSLSCLNACAQDRTWVPPLSANEPGEEVEALLSQIPSSLTIKNGKKKGTLQVDAPGLDAGVYQLNVLLPFEGTDSRYGGFCLVYEEPMWFFDPESEGVLKTLEKYGGTSIKGVNKREGFSIQSKNDIYFYATYDAKGLLIWANDETLNISMYPESQSLYAISKQVKKYTLDSGMSITATYDMDGKLENYEWSIRKDNNEVYIEYAVNGTLVRAWTQGDTRGEWSPEAQKWLDDAGNEVICPIRVEDYPPLL